ncbi:uncharacterized protein PV07_11924 [Cladophialophora immunda]|uniref:RRM domain-containing protein n=2 Tax=Cladophialophora immunda TaxID=569365 RepID=A0A0D1Z7W6_9EURO|nr:uncharacterized protein PV07_11924 [Cladophialophora immunda]KIW23746.1 hypothetical protein PV07_11924 [Cladophialophora immunda]OQV07983.1 RNA recognition motif aka RRM, RBD, or RNP domain-containing protein isoform 4 [Cladophialophora immunda]
MADVSSTRLYLGNLARNITKQDIEEHFGNHGTGSIKEIKLMNGFGFIEYEDAMDARDVVPAFHGTMFKGERLTVQFARGPRRKDDFAGPSDRNVPRPRRTIYRMQITGLQPDTSWQDLKDFARSSGQLDVVYSETGRDRDGKGFVEFETSSDLKTAVEKLDGQTFKGATVHCTLDIQEERPDNRSYRQRSPPRGRYGPADDYDRRGPPPRGWSPRGYRERSPGRRPPIDDYYDRGYGRRTPPRDYGPPPPRRYDPDPYDPRGPPPPPIRGYGDPYARGGDPYGRPRSPPRYGYSGGYGGYDDRRY